MRAMPGQVIDAIVWSDNQAFQPNVPVFDRTEIGITAIIFFFFATTNWISHNFNASLGLF